MAEAGQAESEQDIESKIEDTRQRFKSEYVEASESQDKYDSRDVEKLLRDDGLVEGFLTWRHFVVDDTLKMIDESFQWRREFQLNDLVESSIPSWMFETGAVYLHGYDKEGNKLFWFRVKLHVKDAKTILDKKRYVAFWLERYARREPGMPLTVVFDMSESGLGNIVRRDRRRSLQINMAFKSLRSIQLALIPENFPSNSKSARLMKLSSNPMPFIEELHCV